MQTKVYYNFFTASVKKGRLKTLRNSSCKKLFLQCPCYWYVLIWLNFFIPYGRWKAPFFIKVYRYSEGFSNRNVVTFFETSFLKEVRILRYVHNNNSIPKFQNKFLPQRILCRLPFVTVPHFLINNFLKDAQNLFESMYFSNICQNWNFIILMPLNFYIFTNSNCFCKLRTKSQMTR